MVNFDYQWERANPDDSGLEDIAGASGSVSVAIPSSTPETYNPVSGDIGKKIRMRCTDGVTTHYSPWSATITDTPVLGSVVDDKRALHCSQISSTGWSYNNPSPGVHNLAQTFNGENVVVNPHAPYLFTFLDFTNDDVEVLTDPTYGDYWHMKCGPESHNPFVDHVPTLGFYYYCHNTCLSWQRAIYTDQPDKSWDWYSFAVKMDAGWTNLPDGSLFMEVGYPHIASPPLEIGINSSGNIQATRSAGLWSGYPWPSTEMSPSLYTYAATAGKWVEFLVGIYWSSNKQGQIIIKTRCPENGESNFTTRWQKSAIDTWQWSSSVPKVANGYTTDDIFGPYEQWNSSFSTHAPNFPQHNYSLFGWIRGKTEADVRSYLPA